MPRIKSSSDSGVAAGTAYIYGDAQSYESPSAFWSASEHQITDASSAAGLTIQQIYDGASSSSNGYVMYNDEIPGGSTSTTYGHSKGFLAWSAESAFWLIHSVPKYAAAPSSTSTYTYPSTGLEYGQSMICVSLELSQVDNAFLQFQYNNPQVYGSQWVSSLASELPNGNAFMNQQTVISSSASSHVNITSAGGTSFTHFAKTVAWGESIYGDLIGPYYGIDMAVESWQRPYEDPLTPPTTQNSVYSVRTLQTPSSASLDGTTWKESEDHAKWGVSTSEDSPVVCIGDINKQLSQWKRSGGMLCIVDATFFEAYNSLIATTDESSAKKKKAAAKKERIILSEQ